MPDVNVLVYAHRQDSHREHAAYARWLTELGNGAEPFALSVLVIAGFVRVVTNGKIFREPTPLHVALEFIAELTKRPTARVVAPGADHLELFARLCKAVGATGKLVADAAHAAVAMEHGCEWVSTDSDFTRFRDLRWQHPLHSR